MKTIFSFIALLAISASASICKENLFVHVVYGWKSELALDSANWDVESTGGDRNYYTYDTHNRIVKSVRKTSTVNDTTEFVSVGPDSLVWKTNGIVSANYIKYTPNGYTSVWSDGHGTTTTDSLIVSNDTVFRYENNANGFSDPEAIVSIGYPMSTGYIFKVIDRAAPSDTIAFECTESATECTCASEGDELVKYVRTVKGKTYVDSISSDTFNPEVRYFSVVGTNSLRIVRPSSMVLQREKFYDLVGRLTQQP